MDHLDSLKMKIHKYEPGIIQEFDTLDELRAFDISYITDTRSKLIKMAAKELEIPESDIEQIRSLKSETTEAAGFEFECSKGSYRYEYGSQQLHRILR